MAERTTRDKMWKFALSATHTNGNEMTASKLAEVSGASERSARDLLNTMAQYGVLETERYGNAKVYTARPGYFVEGDSHD